MHAHLTLTSKLVFYQYLLIRSDIDDIVLDVIILNFAKFLFSTPPGILEVQKLKSSLMHASPGVKDPKLVLLQDFYSESLSIKIYGLMRDNLVKIQLT